MTSVQSYIQLSPDTNFEPVQSVQRKRKIEYNIDDGDNINKINTDGGYVTRDKRRCSRNDKLIHNIRTLSNWQYICYIKKPVSLIDVENMIKNEYLRVRESIYKPIYHVEYDLNGNQVYIEDQTNSDDLQGKIWQNLNFHQLYSNLAKMQYDSSVNKFSIQKNVLKFNEIYEIPFNDIIKDYNIIQYRLEQDKYTGRINAVVEIFVETENKTNGLHKYHSSNNNNAVVYPPILEEVTDAMFQVVNE